MNTRLNTMSAVIFIMFFILIVGLCYIQLVRGDFYYNLSEENRIRILPLRGLRGRIFDRHGNLLAINRPSFDIALIRQELKDPDLTLGRLSELTGKTPDHFRQLLNSDHVAPFVPVTILKNVGRKKAFILEEWKPELSGLFLQSKSQRYYPYKEVASHITGYLGEVGPGELKKGKRYGYQIKDLLGRTGIENFFDEYIRGKNGGMQLEVDNRGRHIRTLGLRAPTKGKDIHLTLDIKLQEYLSSLLKGKKGAVIVINPGNGEILSLVNSPAYDPNLFIEVTDVQALRKLLHNPGFPLLNRAIYGAYPAGSIFKIVIAAAGLESKKISPHTRLFCPGSYNLGNSRFLCWDRDGHGWQTITQALTNSCNVFFYKLGMILGPELISDYAAKFGFGQASGIDLPGESKGLVPNKNWKRKEKKSRWYDGDTVNFSIGQGYLLVTPLQVVRMMSVIANGGQLIKPYLVKKIGTVEVAAPRVNTLGISSQTIKIIKEGLKGVVGDPGGTGYRARVAGLELLAKTGTAQAGRRKSHAWFGGFSPEDNSRVSFVIFLEHGGSGGGEAARIAAKLMKFLSTAGYL